MSSVTKPAFPLNNSAGLAVMNAQKPLAKLNGDPDPILDRLRGGESVSQVATSLGLTASSVYEWLLAHCPDQWKSISAAKSLTTIEEAEAELKVADDNIKVSRARERARLAQWNVERVARSHYGDTKADQSGVTINVVIDRSGGGTVIEQS